MTLFGACLLFIIQVAILGLVRPLLLFELSGISLLLFRSQLGGKWLYSLIFLPGTIIHELSHWIVAEILGVRTGEISIIPNFESDESGRERLGSVATASSGPIKSFIIGAAPFFSGMAILSVLGSLFAEQKFDVWQYLLLGYGILVTGSSMMLSREDRRSWPFIGILTVVVTTIFLATPLDFPLSWLAPLIAVFTSLNQVLFLATLIILFVIGLSKLTRRIIEKILGKNIIRKKYETLSYWRRRIYR